MDIEALPEDILEFTPTSKLNLSNLKFDAMLSNIKVMNSPKVSVFLIEALVIPKILHLGHSLGTVAQESPHFRF